MIQPVAKTPHHTGHRARLRERFLDSLTVAGESNLPDYELLELILTAAKPRSDVKPLAKQLINEFGSLAGVLSAQPAALARINGMGDAGISAIKVARAASIRAMAEPLKEQPAFSHWEAVIDYCQLTMSRCQIEQFRVFYLDTKNRLISDELQQHGTVDHTPVYPREVVKRALELGASAIILAHNHPSGDCTPSKADKIMTNHLVDAASALNILVHDHLIIGGQNHFSFASNGLL